MVPRDAVVSWRKKTVKRKKKIQIPAPAEDRRNVLLNARQVPDLDSILLFEGRHASADDPRLFHEEPDGRDQEPHERIENEDSKQ